MVDFPISQEEFSLIDAKYNAEGDKKLIIKNKYYQVAKKANCTLLAVIDRM